MLLTTLTTHIFVRESEHFVNEHWSGSFNQVHHPMYIKAGLKTLCVEMSVLLFSICIFLFLYDNLKWISFFNYFSHLWYIFLCVCTIFCLCAPSYGYIIFGMGSHIPIFNFKSFCWSDFFFKIRWWDWLFCRVLHFWRWWFLKYRWYICLAWWWDW